MRGITVVVSNDWEACYFENVCIRQDVSLMMANGTLFAGGEMFALQQFIRSTDRLDEYYKEHNKYPDTFEETKKLLDNA